ncbi:MAG: hypothetical protein ACE5LX_00170 [Nitrospinota bacterium]
MTRLEYLVIHLHIERDGLKEAEARLNELGEEGWELVSVVGCLSGDADAYLKRHRERDRE